MPNTYQMSSLPSHTPSSPSRIQPTAFYHPDHAKWPIVNGSPDVFQIEVVGRRKKVHGIFVVYSKWSSIKFGLADRGGGC